MMSFKDDVEIKQFEINKESFAKIFREKHGDPQRFEPNPSREHLNLIYANRRFSDSEIRRVRGLSKEGLTAKQILKKFSKKNVTISTIYSIIKRKIYGDII